MTDGSGAEPLATQFAAAMADVPDATVGVAVSGGGDSMALLDLACCWAEERSIRILAVTVDHGLRPEAASEAALVAAHCAGRGVAYSVARWTGWNGQGNLQAAARAARYGLIGDWARSMGVETVLLGHTLDDQAETVLMRLARAAGSDGLGGMRDAFARGSVRFLRPLLGVSRDALRQHLAVRGIHWAEDSSNADDRFDRIKARQVLGHLAPLGIDAPVLGRVARQLQAENRLLRRLLVETVAGRVTETNGALSISAADWAVLDPELARRFLRLALPWLTGAEYPPRGEAVDTLLGAIAEGRTATLGGAVARVTKGRLWLAREYSAVKTTEPQAGAWDRWRIGGPVPQDHHVAALGPDGLRALPDWRDRGLPREVLLPLPAVWRGQTLVSVPLLRHGDGPPMRFSPPEFVQVLASH